MTLEALDTEDEAQAAVPVGTLLFPPRIAQWAELIAIAAATHGVPESLVAAVMDRETEGGEAPGYTPKGAAGTGDWTARVGHWLRADGAKVVTELPPGWLPPPHDSFGPFAIPADGLGWGRGLMQIDFANAQRIDWRDAAQNIDHGTWMLSVALAEFPKSPRSGIASYNCGAGNVRRALLAGLDVDHYTTGGDYSADVMRRAAKFKGEA